MVRKAAVLGVAGMLMALAGCTETGKWKVPFTKDSPFVASAAPADFTVVVDENHDTHFARQHIHQVVSAADATSRTRYTTFRDLNNAVSNDFSQETPLSPTQLQNMWNDVARYDLLNRSTVWVNWLSDSDLYKRDTYTMQIRANGQTRTYRTTNGFAGSLRPLVLQIEAVRLPVSQNSTTPVVPGQREAEKELMNPATAPSSQPGELMPVPPMTQPATQPSTEPAK
jgi:hypothetical protein